MFPGVHTGQEDGTARIVSLPCSPRAVSYSQSERGVFLEVAKPVVCPNTALHAVCLLRGASTYLGSAFPAHSISFSPNFSNPQRWNEYQVVNQNCYLW